jgi:hypothetical protein
MRLICVILVIATSTIASIGQPAMPTSNVLTRVLMIQSQYARGTVFSIDVDGREYWITAKHILTGAEHPPYGEVKAGKLTLQVLNPGADGEEWIKVEFSVIDTGSDIDEVVLAPATPLLDGPLPSAKASSDRITLGGDCTFLGFPYGGGWRAKFDTGKSFWMPYIKRCAVSASLHDPQRIWILDGINNAGFSGGPVLAGTGLDQQIFAVISGYHTEPAEVIASDAKHLSPPPQTPAAKLKESVNVNSGFIISYDISYAIDAIHKNPIGPVRAVQP